VSKDRVIVTTRLAAPAEDVWRAVTSIEGIRHELAPLVRMTFPAELAALGEDTVPIGRRLCRSWLLAGGVVPVDYDDVTLVELEPGRRFLEESAMGSLAWWRHERIVEPLDAATSRVTDRLGWRARVAPADWLARKVVPWLFAHRHARLTQRFGAA
jgi:hypothetical protein